MIPAGRGLLGLVAFDWLDLAVILAGSALPYLAIEFTKEGQRSALATRSSGTLPGSLTSTKDDRTGR